MRNSPKIIFSERVRKMTHSAVFAALICVATIVIQIPSPMTGYVNLGDAVVLLAAFSLGFPYGGAAAGIGSALADMVTGYFIYAPGTFLIKGAMAFAAYPIYIKCRAAKMPVIASAVLAGIVAEGIMVFGYFLYAALILGNGLSAASSVPGNIMQGVAGIVISSVLGAVLEKKRVGRED